MEDDHIDGLVAAIDADDNEAAKQHGIALLKQMFSYLERAVTALEHLSFPKA